MVNVPHKDPFEKRTEQVNIRCSPQEIQLIMKLKDRTRLSLAEIVLRGISLLASTVPNEEVRKMAQERKRYYSMVDARRLQEQQGVIETFGKSMTDWLRQERERVTLKQRKGVDETLVLEYIKHCSDARMLPILEKAVKEGWDERKWVPIKKLAQKRLKMKPKHRDRVDSERGLYEGEDGIVRSSRGKPVIVPRR